METDGALSSDAGDVPAVGSSPDEIAWTVVRAQLASDEHGREILLQLTEAPEEGAVALRRYLASGVGQVGFNTVITGGVIDRVVNIAHAGVVNIAAAKAIVPPRQLPADPADFTDRIELVTELLDWATPGDGVGRGSLVCAIVGGGGVGKTALAVHTAHLLTETFADAQLYVNLQGLAARPLPPDEVLEALLRALGVEPSRIPAGTAERSGLYRAALSGRRSVIVLDNAASESQVRPLLPGDGTSAVLITSRHMLAALEAARHLVLDVLAPADAGALLAVVVGVERTAAEPEAAVALARSCGYLPLAIRIVAARLASKPHWSLGRMVSRLEDANRRLSELEVGDLAVRASFALSYDALPPDLRQTLRLASLVPGPTFPAWVVAALANTDTDDAEERIEQLADLQLVEYAGVGGSDRAHGELRYQMHDLLRLFAHERLAAEDAPEAQTEAVERCLGAYLTVARRGLYLLSPGSKRDPDPGISCTWPVPHDLVDALLSEPLAWFASEHASVVGAIRQAYSRQFWPYVYELAEQLHIYFRVSSALDDWENMQKLAVTATRAAGDRRAEGWALRNLGNALQDRGRSAEAAQTFSAAASIFAAIGNDLGQAATLCNLGETRMGQGRFAEAVDNLTRCLPGWQRVDDRVGIAYTLDNLGYIKHCQGDFAAADEYFRVSRPMFVQLGDRFGEAHSLRRRGNLNTDRASFVDAMADLERSRAIFASTPSPVGEAWAVIGMAGALLGQGRPAEALEKATSAVRSFHDAGDEAAATKAMVTLGEALLANGREAEAGAVLNQARERLHDLGDEFGQALAAYHLGRVTAYRGDAAAAAVLLQEAAASFGRMPSQLWQSRARQQLDSLPAT